MSVRSEPISEVHVENDRTSLEPREFRPVDLRFLDLADVPEQVGADIRILPGRSRLADHLGQLELARHHRSSLRHRGIVDKRNRAENRLTPVAVDDLAKFAFVFVRDLGEQLDRLVQIPAALADDLDRFSNFVDDERALLPIEQDSSRRRQRNHAEPVVLGHRVELVVLHDLQDPERDGEQAHADDGERAEHGQPRLQAATIFESAGRQHPLTIAAGSDSNAGSCGRGKARWAGRRPPETAPDHRRR